MSDELKIPVRTEDGDCGSLLYIGPCQCGDYPGCGDIVIAVIDPEIKPVAGEDKLACTMKFRKRDIPHLVKYLECLA